VLTPLCFAPLSFFLGSNKVLQVALGRSAEDEHRPGLAALATRLRGDSGLLFTNMERSELETALADAATAHHARAGTTAEDTVELDAGPLIGKARPKSLHSCTPHSDVAFLPAAGRLAVSAHAGACAARGRRAEPAEQGRG